MPNRILREGINDSDRVNALSFAAEVFYRRLMSVVDDFGLYDGRLSVLRSRLYSLRVDTVSEKDINDWLTECERLDLVVRYEHNGKPYIYFRNLGEPRAAKSKYPFPPESALACKHMRADASTCAQPQTSVPYSYSYSYSLSDSKSNGTAGGSDQAEEPKPKTTREAKATAPPTFPAILDTPEFREAWSSWEAHRREKREKLTPTSVTRQLRMLEGLGLARAIACIEHTILKGWTGLREPDRQASAITGPKSKFKDMNELVAHYAKEGAS